MGEKMETFKQLPKSIKKSISFIVQEINTFEKLELIENLLTFTLKNIKSN
jgi:ABC-type sugar transport system ATPase subunit